MMSGAWTNRKRVVGASRPLFVQTETKQSNAYNPLQGTLNCKPDYSILLFYKPRCNAIASLGIYRAACRAPGSGGF